MVLLLPFCSLSSGPWSHCSQRDTVGIQSRMAALLLGKPGQQGKVAELLFMWESNWNVLSSAKAWVKNESRAYGCVRVEHWSWLHREAVQSPFLERFKTHLDAVLGNLLEVTLEQGDWAGWPPEAPASPIHSLFLWLDFHTFVSLQSINSVFVRQSLLSHSNILIAGKVLSIISHLSPKAGVWSLLLGCFFFSSGIYWTWEK